MGEVGEPSGEVAQPRVGKGACPSSNSGQAGKNGHLLPWKFPINLKNYAPNTGTLKVNSGSGIGVTFMVSEQASL